MPENGVTGVASQAMHNSTFEHVARAGHVVSGLAHLIIGYIIILLAFGGRGNADQSGAFETVASRPGGIVALWIGVAAFAALALWRCAEAVLGRRTTDEPKEDNGISGLLDRGKSLSLAVVYFGFALSAAQFARGGGKSSGKQSAGLSARMMESGAGRTILVIVGIVAVAVGIYHVYKGVTKRFLDDLHKQHGTLIEPLGVVGYVAKGLAITGAGILVIVAAATSDPSKATGIDGAVKTLGSVPFGQVLLVSGGLGIIAYALYSFVMARYAKM